MDSMLKGFIKAFAILAVVFSVFYIVSYNIWEHREFGNDIDFSKYLEEERHEYEEQVDTVDSETVRKLYSSINYPLVEDNFGKDFFSFYYQQDKMLAKDFSCEFVIYLAIVNLEKDKWMVECHQEEEIPSATVDSKIKELFGSSYSYEKKSYQNDKLTIAYDASKDSYTVTNTSCSGIPLGEDRIATELIEGKIENEKLVITEYAYYVSYEEMVNGGYLLNYHAGVKKDSEILSNNVINQLDKSKLQIYQYTFAKEQNRYYLEQIEKIR